MKKRNTFGSRITTAAILAALIVSFAATPISAATDSLTPTTATASVSRYWASGSASTATVKISGGYLNLRSGASGSSAVIGQLSKGETVTVLQQVSGGWVQVKTAGGKTGYCSGQYLQIKQAAAPQPSTPPSGNTAPNQQTATVKISGGYLNLRSGASGSSAVIGQLSKGETVTVLQQVSGGWVQVKTAGGKTGYCSGQYLQIKQAAAPQPSTPPSGNTAPNQQTATVKISGGYLNLRSGASGSSAVIGQLGKGETVTVLQQVSGGWVQVKTAGGKTGYCSGQYLQIKQAAAPQPSAPPSGGGSVAKTATVKVSSVLNLRSGASTSSSVIGQLRNGESVTVLDTTGSWTHVQTQNGVKGYCSSSYLVAGSSGNAEETLGSSKTLSGLPNFKQADARWANTYLGGADGGSIAVIGCTVTSLAMSESYRTQTTVTPNDIKRQCQFTDGGGLYWPSNYFNLSDVSDTNLLKIYQQIRADKPVIVGGSNSATTHWVIIKGYKNVPLNASGSPASLDASMFLINDPGYDSCTLADYIRQFPSGRVYRTYA